MFSHQLHWFWDACYTSKRCQASCLVAEEGMWSREVFFSSLWDIKGHFYLMYLMKRIQWGERNCWLEESNYSGNSWRRVDITWDTTGGVGFDVSKYTSSNTNRTEDRECTIILEGKVWRWRNEGASNTQWWMRQSLQLCNTGWEGKGRKSFSCSE